MKILFLKRGPERWGSNRIYVNNLSKWLKPYFNEVKISETIEADYDIYILSKYSKYNDIQYIKSYFPKSIVGIIHPNDLKKDGLMKLKDADFCIVGSIEEMDHFLEYNENIFRFPQIEVIKKIRKKHAQSKIFRMGYHGNKNHLNELGDPLKNALEKLSNEINIELTVIYDLKYGQWKQNRPKIKIKVVDWTFDAMVDEMSKVDVGIVPCTNVNFLDRHYRISNFHTRKFKKMVSKSGKDHDYMIQFKPYSNAGRSAVFHQLGIPVIADFWPSHFEILSNKMNGRLAHSEAGWYYALKELAESSTLRQSIADSAFLEFTSKYDPTIWAEQLAQYLRKKIQIDM